jgi:hypothetical protein
MLESHTDWVASNAELVIPILFFAFITIGAIFMEKPTDE